ncbi:IQ domain-containing protein M [Sorex fumeus]|uniref:IQ domain-containing protein M n=1 Tax=Sorex fumeus TaxID=62283 RepID=UPI0024AD618A|nr:IQ domain-containing protein M [Sorex fumeus]
MTGVVVLPKDNNSIAGKWTKASNVSKGPSPQGESLDVPSTGQHCPDGSGGVSERDPTDINKGDFTHLWYIEKPVEEKVELCKIMTDIDPVSKKMEKENQDQGKIRMQSCFSRRVKYNSKVKRIGPHIEIFQLFRKKKKPKTDSKMIEKVVVMQAAVRGWLERKRMQRILAKVLDHGKDLREVINKYSSQIYRVKYGLGLPRTRQILRLSDLEEWMDRKKYYETMFAKRQDWQGINRNELLKFFNDCGHFPALHQIDDIWNLVHIGQNDRYNEVIKKNVAIEMLFTLYPPQGAQVKENKRSVSTWLRPIVDGEEGYKYIVTNHPILKRADIRIVGKLVARSIRERKIRQHRLL